MTCSPLISAAEEVLRQGSVLLESIDEDSYTHQGHAPFESSIGAHYRHVLDHFICLIEGLRSSEINYDHRARNRQIEESVNAALRATNDLISSLRRLSANTLQEQCTVVYSVGYEDQAPYAVSSVVARELMFCVGHAIHHYAILKLLCSARAVTLPYEFGVAPSTLKHLEAQATR